MTDPSPTPRTYSAEEWLRSIEFPDASPDTGADPPVHVACKPVLFNGKPTTAQIMRDTFEVTASSQDATVVSLTVHAADVEFKDFGGQGVVPYKLAGLRILSPLDRKPEVQPGGDDAPALVRLHLFVRSVAFTGAPEAANPEPPR
jgi:hypothetical protein